MKNKQLFRPRSGAFALEPRVLFDGAAAVAVEDHLSAGDPLAHHVDTAEVRPASTVEAPAAAPAPSVSPTTLLVIDSRVADYQSLQSDLPGNVMVRIISADESGIAAIDAAINSSSNIQSIQIISHGSSGSISLGSDIINSSTLSSSSARLQSWAPHLTADADILLYGCDVAAGPDGTTFLNQLAALTGADIAASIDATGAAAKGGNWTLEASTGTIESRLAIGDAKLMAYDGLLVAPTLTDSVGSRSTNEDTALAITGITLSDPDAGNSQSVTIIATNGTITLNDTNGLSSISGNGSASIRFMASAAKATTAMNGMSFAPTADFAGTASFAISTNDGEMTTTLGTRDITVTPVNDAPTIFDSVSSRTTTEDNALTIVCHEGALRCVVLHTRVAMLHNR